MLVLGAGLAGLRCALLLEASGYEVIVLEARNRPGGRLHTLYEVPAGAARAEVRVFHQTTTKEYIEFLRDANVTNNAGQIAYDQWVLHGKSEPTLMDFASIDLYPCLADVNVDGGVDGGDIEAFFLLWSQGSPSVDFNVDGGVDGMDVEAFFGLWEQGC